MFDVPFMRRMERNKFRQQAAVRSRGCGKTLWARQNFIGMYVLDNKSTPQDAQKGGLLTRPTLARRDAPWPRQGRSSTADPRFTFHASRFTAPGSAARTPLADFFSILLERSN